MSAGRWRPKELHALPGDVERDGAEARSRIRLH
jgi:hypothetical protein